MFTFVSDFKPTCMKITTFAMAIGLCFQTLLYAQTSSDTPVDLKNQGQTSLEQKEYIKARYYFKQAFRAFAACDEYEQAVKCGVQANALYLRENLYKEGFDLCRDIDQVIAGGEQKHNRPLYGLRFTTTQERLKMFTSLKNPAKAKEQLYRLEEIANQAKNDSLNETLLYTKADYYYTFGQNQQGDACFQQLITQYKDKKDYDKVSDCYRTLIGLATKAGNAPLVGRTYDKYIVWTDSVKTLTAQDELNVLKRKYDSSRQTLAGKEHELSVKQYKIIALCTLCLILVAALVLGAIVLLRFILMNKKLKKNIEIANEHSQLKSQFIGNISAQMEPTLDALAAVAADLPDAPQQSKRMLSQVDALKKFAEDIQELSSLENTLNEPYGGAKEINVNTFCENTMNKVKEFVDLDVETVVEAAKLQIKTNPEQLERILTHLLKNAAFYTTTGKISLEYKRRAAHTHQFIVTDTGPGIAPEQQEDLFKPFTEIKNLTEGDGLGLPICSLVARKLNGTLSYDASYKKGARFVLELHV